MTLQKTRHGWRDAVLTVVVAILVLMITNAFGLDAWLATARVT